MGPQSVEELLKEGTCPYVLCGMCPDHEFFATVRTLSQKSLIY